MHYAEKLNASLSIYFTHFKKLFPYSLLCLGASLFLNQLVNFTIAQMVEREILGIYQSFLSLGEITSLPLLKLIGISMLLHLLSFPLITYLILFFLMVVLGCIEERKVEHKALANKMYFKFLSLNLIWFGIFFLFSIFLEFHPIALIPIFFLLPIFAFSMFSMLIFDLGVNASMSLAISIFRRKVIASFTVMLIAVLISIILSIPFYLAASLLPVLASVVQMIGIITITPLTTVFLMLAFKELSQG